MIASCWEWDITDLCILFASIVLPVLRLPLRRFQFAQTAVRLYVIICNSLMRIHKNVLTVFRIALMAVELQIIAIRARINYVTNVKLGSSVINVGKTHLCPWNHLNVFVDPNTSKTPILVSHATSAVKDAVHQVNMIVMGPAELAISNYLIHQFV